MSSLKGLYVSVLTIILAVLVAAEFALGAWSAGVALIVITLFGTIFVLLEGMYRVRAEGKKMIMFEEKFAGVKS